MRALKLGVVIIALWLPATRAFSQGDPSLPATFADLPTDPQTLADLIVDDIAEIRGLEFKKRITVRDQSVDEFEQYLDAELHRALPADRAASFGRVVHKLGLYEGPVIEDMDALVKMVMTSQAAAYYNPDDSAFYVLMPNAPPMMLATIYAHELYHGLQDQQWDLDAYLLDAQGNGLDDDAILARQAVVEGEATYIMTLWMMKKLTGQIPQGFPLEMAVRMQSEMDVTALRGVMMSGVVPELLGDDMQKAMNAMADIPAFMIETLIGAYLKGMGFIYYVVKDGWDDAARLYTNPPQSSEQILHPEKWLAGDTPVAIDLGDLGAEPALEGWAELDTNVIGEFQWRIIFDEHGMKDRSNAIAAGWDGDRYSVLENDGDLLLLLYTTWDDETEAAEFASAYAELLEVKYDGEEATRIDVRGKDVLIVEGGDPGKTAAYLAVLGRARKTY